MSWADRCAYCAHDLEDAASVGIVDLASLPATVAEVAGRSACFPAAVFYWSSGRVHYLDRRDRDAPTVRRRPGDAS